MCVCTHTHTHTHTHIYIYIYIHMKVVWKVNVLKSSYYDVISAVDDSFDQWDPSIAAPIEKMCECKEDIVENKPHLVSFHESILVCRWIFLFTLYIYIYIERERKREREREFVNGPGDRSSIPDRVLPKTQKWYLMPPCLTLSFLR